jgi:hypothetical protein
LQRFCDKNQKQSDVYTKTTGDDANKAMFTQKPQEIAQTKQCLHKNHRRWRKQSNVYTKTTGDGANKAMFTQKPREMAQTKRWIDFFPKKFKEKSFYKPFKKILLWNRQ